MSKITTIQIYLEAKTKDDLIKRMVENNLRNQSFYNYSTPTKDGDKYITWYYEDIIKAKRLESGD